MKFHIFIHVLSNTDGRRKIEMILIILSVSVVSLAVATLAFYIYCLATRTSKKKGNDCMYI